MKTSILSLFLLVFLLGCGYQLVGKETHVPEGITSVAIPTLENKTLEPGIEIPFTQAFLNEFISDRRVKVVSRGEADAILEGSIKIFRITSVSYNPSGLALEYESTVVMDVVLKRSDGKEIWRERNLSQTEWFRTSSSGVLNEASKDAAIQALAKPVAERIRNRYFYNF